MVEFTAHERDNSCLAATTTTSRLGVGQMSNSGAGLRIGLTVVEAAEASQTSNGGALHELLEAYHACTHGQSGSQD